MEMWQWWLRTQIRRLRESSAIQKLRYCIRRQSPRRLALVLCTLIFVLYCLISSRTSFGKSVSQSCLDENLSLYDEELKNVSMARDADGVKFTGNGYIGIDENGELRTISGKTLSFLTGFRPLVSLTFDGVFDVKQALLTNFLKGKLINVQCFSVEGECVCSSITTFVHRTRKNILMEEVKIVNPSNALINLQMEREESPLWMQYTGPGSPDKSLVMRDDMGSKSGSILCSSIIANTIIHPKREETFRLTCAIDIREKIGDGWRRRSIDTVMSEFAHTKENYVSTEREHDNAWAKLNAVTFYLSHSLAPNVLNGVVINATRYAIITNVRAPLLEERELSLQDRKMLELKGARRDLCYTGHSTMMYPSRLWTKARNSEELMSLVDTWLLTLEKRGCANVLSLGANGIGQAFVLSLSAATFHDGHLELGLNPADMHREMSVSGLELNDKYDSKLSFRVGIQDDNRPFLVVSSSSEIYACDGGCRSDPIRVSPFGTRISVMLTKPLTSILYIAPNKKYLTQLRSAIHVSHVDVAPAHEIDLLSAHKGEGGLPLFVWVIFGLILVAFHLFLIKLLYSEWKKSDSTPYNPFLRQKYFREH